MDCMSFEYTLPEGTALVVVIMRQQIAIIKGNLTGDVANAYSWQGYVGLSSDTSAKFDCDLQCGIGGSEVGYKHNITFDSDYLRLGISNEEKYPRWVGFDTANHPASFLKAHDRAVSLAHDLLTGQGHTDQLEEFNV